MKIIPCDECPEDTIYLVPPIPVVNFIIDGKLYTEDYETALKRHAKENPKQFGMIKLPGKKGT